MRNYSKKLLLFLFCLIATSSIFSQSLNNTLYKDFVFEKVTKTKNQSYSTNIPAGAKERVYRFDFYQPQNDTSHHRPLVIWMHGGGFKLGSKKARGIPKWSKTFAQHGYTCAAINYRKSKKKPLKKFADLAAGCYEAIQDLDQAITYFKLNQQLLGIDTNRIILAGNSAGAMIAIQAVYSSPASLSKLSGDTSHSEFKYANDFSNIAGIINFWGAIFDTTMLHKASVPIVSVHGTTDGIVPYKQKDAPLNGSFYIQQQATAIGIPSDLKSYEGYAHELQKHFNPIFVSGAVRKRWLEAGKFASDFLYRQLFK